AMFSPQYFMHTYAPDPLHRDAGLMVVGDFAFELMQPLPPVGDDPGTTLYRYRERYGAGPHSIAFYATDIPELDERLQAIGVRTTGGGLPAGATTLFTHPK